jgi:autotransporter family porin
MKTIHGAITTSVTLGAGGYGAGLTIATDGAVAPTQAGADAIYAPSSLTNAHVVNHGTVLGAYGDANQSGPGGVGILLAGGGKVVNSGLVEGGRGGANSGDGGAGVVLQAAGSVSNTGTIFGGDSYTGNGGVGVDLAQGGALVNHGAIYGGGGYYGNGDLVDAIGVYLGAAGTVQNFGKITSGYSTGFSRGFGIDLAAGGTLINRGIVDGSTGGGGGVEFAGHGQIKNFGTIQGGPGDYYTPNGGGQGVSLSGGGTLTNHGTIAGGYGAQSYHYSGGHGGDGVDIDGGTLIAASGTIAGGAGGSGTHKGAPGNAVGFGSAAGTLVVDPAAQFVGDIVANTAVNDTLVLSGTTAGTLSGLGKTVTGFTTVTESAHATWTLQGTLTGAGTLTIGSGSHLELSGPVSIATIQFANGAQNLELDKPGAVTSTFAGFGTGDSIDLVSINAASLQYANGTLTLLDANGKALDKLLFSGSYSQSDFALHSIANGTELDYAGPAPATLGAFEDTAGHAFAFHDDPFAMMHDWHLPIGRD